MRPGEEDDPLPILYQEQNTYIILDVEEALENPGNIPRFFESKYDECSIFLCDLLIGYI